MNSSFEQTIERLAFPADVMAQPVARAIAGVIAAGPIRSDHPGTA